MRAEGQDRVFTIEVGSWPRHYRVHEPTGYDARRPVPLVLILHGAGGTATWTLGETGWAATADRDGFLALLPEGTRADPNRPPGFLNNPQVWNDGSPRARLGRPGVDDVGFLAAVLDQVQAHYAVDPAQVFATGFSNGAGMVFRLAAELSPRLAAIAPVAGHWWLPDRRPTRPMPTLYLVGDADPLVPLQGGDVISPWDGQVSLMPPVGTTLERLAVALGRLPGPHLIRDDHGIRVTRYGPGPGDVELLAYVISGLGHHWPGGRGQLNRRLAGPPSQRLDANDLIWDFFRAHAPTAITPPNHAG